MSAVAPPLFRLAWNLGLPIPPPQFLGFGALTAVMGVPFGVIWGAFMWLAIWKRQGVGIGGTVVASMFAGVLFGMVMAFFFRRKARKLCLPAWCDYGERG